MEEIPDKEIAVIQSISPLITFPRGFWILIGGYDHQPDDAGPPGTKKLNSKTIEKIGTNQKAKALSFGKAISGAPIIGGTNKLVNPLKMGNRNKNNIIVPCIV